MVSRTRFVLSASLGLWLLLATAANGQAATPVVVFEADTPGGRQAAATCAAVWDTEGPRLAADLLGTPPAAGRPDTVTCLVLNTDAFQSYFGNNLPDWGVGVALPTGRVIAVDYTRMSLVGRGLREVFLHEMVHALLFLGSKGALMPAWLHEGAAMQYSGEWRFSDTVSLVLDGRVPDLGRLQGRFPVSHANADRAYRTSLLAVNRLQKRHGQAVVAELAAATGRSGNFPAAFLEVTGEDLGTFYQDFAGAMQLRFGWLVMLVSWPSLFVLLALVLTLGAIRKIILNKRRLATMEDDFPPPEG